MKAILTNTSVPLHVGHAADIALNYVTAGNPSRTIVNDENGNWLASYTNNCRTVSLRGKQRSFVEYSQGIVDSFSRTLADSWGSTENGGKWFLTGGVASEFNASAGEASMVCADTGLARRASIGNIVQDLDALVRFKTNKAAAGGHQIAGMMFGYQNIDNNYLARVSFMTPTVMDSFERTIINGWGSASSGHSWSIVGGASTDYSTNGSEGVHSLNSVNVSRRTVISAADATDFNTVVKIKSDVLANGASITSAILGRYQDSNNHYIFRIRFSSLAARQVLASIQKNVAGTVSTVGSEVATVLTHTAGTYYWIRAEAQGATLRMRIWRDGAAEPSSWDVSVVDSTFSGAGNVGVRSILATGNTNTLPVQITYDDFQAIRDNETRDSVEIEIQVRVGGVFASVTTPLKVNGLFHAANDWFKLRVQHYANGTIRGRVWKDGDIEPSAWHVAATNTTYTAGRVGLRSIVNTGTTNLPVTFSYDDLIVTASWPANPMVQHEKWIRILPTAFNGTVDEVWLRAALQDISPDILAVAMQYIGGAPIVIDPSRAGLRIMGDANYGPLATDGKRIEGSDFNDYLGIPWPYGSTVDNNEANQIYSLDCSGYIRMVYGYRLGMPMRLTTLDGVSIPRVSSAMVNGGPGILIIQSTTQVTDMTLVLPGDIVAFDADTSNPSEEEGQIDHVGIYLGTDLFGNHRFISARKTINGPTFSDLGGASVVAPGSNLYARSFRAVRRF